MRKDVRLGMAIGGVLLIVVVVYFIVTLGGNSHPEVTLDQPTDDSSAPVTDAASTPVTPVAPVSTTVSAAGDHSPVRRIVDSRTESADHTSTPDRAGIEVTRTERASDGTPDTRSPDRTSDDWATALRGEAGGRSSSTPLSLLVGNPSAGTPSRDEAILSETRHGNATDSQTLGDRAEKASPFAASGSPRTHIVQNGDTFTSIAQSKLGSIRYIDAIMHANPGIDPLRLRPGMTINLPEVHDAQPAPRTDGIAPAASRTLAPGGFADNGGSAFSEPTGFGMGTGGNARTAAVVIDPNTSYIVQSGDSLYRIAIRLYGDARMNEKIYQLNKEHIGADPARLKLNMVLQLPEPPLRTN